MREATFVVALMLLIIACDASGTAKSGATAHYRIAGAGEHETPPFSDVWITADARIAVGKKPCQWWRMTMRKQDGSVLAVKALSREVPMTSATAPGEIFRYIFKPASGEALEYIDLSTGWALLPQIEFKRAFLPRPGPDARYHRGFASAGSMVGHFACLLDDGAPPPEADFSDARVLKMRTDFIIGTSRAFRDDGTEPEKPDGEYTYVTLTRKDLEQLIAAGHNYFHTIPDLRDWMLTQPAFIAGAFVYPDDLYRSNVRTEAMFIDEPQTRLGWSGGIPSSPLGPEQVAQALRMRVAVQERLSDRLLKPARESLGTLDLAKPRSPSWETEFWSAWYQLQGGATGIVHEGRYRHRGFGYEPELLLGEGLEGLTDRDQFNIIYAFLRGAARSFNGDWGTSLYGQSDPELRLPAFIRAYQMGAKYLWFWTSDHGHHMPFTEQLRLSKAICDYARKHPRADRKTMLRQAEVGIALPPGYAFNFGGTWGMEREKLNPFGVSYGDISAAMFWEGVICSRRGIEFDFLVDHPGIEKLGYKRLVIIREDGSVKVTPPWPQKRAPKDLRISVQPDKGKLISSRQNAHPDFHIARAAKMTIDGDLSDWAGASWISLGEDRWFGDSFKFSTKLRIVQTSDKPKGNTFQGFDFERLTPELARKYKVEAYPQEELAVITAIEPDSPADHAGLKVGDVITYLGKHDGARDMNYDRVVGRIRQAVKEDEVVIEGRRSGFANYGGPSDLSAEVALLLDDKYLYFAAKVGDDAHVQKKRGWDIWTQDSVQIALDPILDRNKGDYGENDHEIGFALSDGKTIAWRWRGRRGQPLGPMKNVKAKAVSKDGFTIYEAAIPISELMPFAPDLWPKLGMDIVVNDTDIEGQRKGRLELVPDAITHGKNPDRFAVFECAPSPNAGKLSAALIWDRRCMPENGAAELTLAAASPKTREAILRAELNSLDGPTARPAVREATIVVSPTPSQYRLRISSKSPAGRYRLKMSVQDRAGTAAAADRSGVFVYPL